MLKKILIFAGILLLVIIIFNSVVMPFYVKHSKMTKVPNIVGMNFNDAKQILNEAGLDVKQGDIRYDESKPVGQVLEQNPPADEQVKVGRRIYLVISGGEQMIEVPKLSGRSLRDAKYTVEQRNLQIGNIVKKYSNLYQEDMIISQVIQPGSRVKKNTKIDVIISQGAQLGDIIVPDVTGKSLADAKKMLLDKKLSVGKITYQPSDLPTGKVLDQYPRKDKSVNEKTNVDLFVAKKREVKENLQDDEEPTIDKNTDKQDKQKVTKAGKSNEKQNENNDKKMESKK
jgi:serine/threonine-protein kinase